jgi:replicative DNA helicase
LLTDRLPPQNLEAEQGVLGSILLDNDALHEVVPVLKVEDFYRDTHQILYRTIRELYDLGKAIDCITLAEELTRRNQFKTIGGDETLAQIVHCVPHAANAKHYADIVRQKAISRSLIECANEILRNGYSNSFTAQELLEAAEQQVFNIAEEQTKGDTVDLKDVLVDAMSRVARRAEEQHAVTGVATGYFELDDITAGFQGEQLIILAARPSIGKTALALNICEHAAVEKQIPTLFVSLEMGRMELAERLLCSKSRVDGHKLRTGKGFANSDLHVLGKAYENLRLAPLFIDDTPARNMLQVTANARRLKLRQNLGLIVLDYIQLVDSEDSQDSRQEQIAKISRRLKTLARDLKVPVIALSQLNRAVENREDRRPRMADLRECVTGDTLVTMADGTRVPIRDLVGTQPEVLSISASGQVIHAQSDKVWCVGRRPVKVIRLASGRTLKATELHRLYGLEGWVRVRDLKLGDRLAIARTLPEPMACARWPEERLILLERLSLGLRTDPVISFPRSAWECPPGRSAASPRPRGTADAERRRRHSHAERGNEVVSLATAVCADDDILRDYASSDLFWDRVVAIDDGGEEEVFDLTVPGPASWLADGIVSHNSGAIEQDADLVLLLHRPDYYDPNDQPGVAELIIAKNRNGATGTVKLTFLKHITRFENLATVIEPIGGAPY